MRGSLY